MEPTSARPRVALLCSGLGHVARGHEVFASELFALVSGHVDMVLFKGAGKASALERVVPCILRDEEALSRIHVSVAPKWRGAKQEMERLRIEHETFAYGALPHLLRDSFDVVHCLEQEVCNIIFSNRHLFRTTPRLLFSNGGAIPGSKLPRCDFVQEHSIYNLAQSDPARAFYIPHGVDCERFRPGLQSDYRRRHGIRADAFVVLSVGTVCVHHKRMDHVIREVAQVPGAHLVIVGQANQDTPEIMALGRALLADRITFDRLSHDELPQAYAAADVFVLGSLFETFGIVYIEAMAMGLPVFCTNHANQRQIVQQGVFVDMSKPGQLARALRDTSRERLRQLADAGRQIAESQYDLRLLRQAYLDRYSRIAESSVRLPEWRWQRRFTERLQRPLQAALSRLQSI